MSRPKPWLLRRSGVVLGMSLALSKLGPPPFASVRCGRRNAMHSYVHNGGLLEARPISGHVRGAATGCACKLRCAMGLSKKINREGEQARA